ncbi:MAG TPA: hypothetical protein PLL10_01130, partial [Elusimicrobiales bacterium]|nr:hypothetical protein [Elusimicrobiales bacterium]
MRFLKFNIERPKHFTAVCLAALSGSLVLGSYGFTRNASTALFLNTFGAANMPYNMAVVPLAMFAAAWLLNKALSRFGSLRALLLSFLFFLVLLGLALLFIDGGQSQWAVALFDIVVQVFVVVMIEQHWSFFNSVLSETQAKTYNGPILTLLSTGPMITGGLTGLLAEKIGTKGIMLTGLAMILPAMLLMILAYRLVVSSDPEEGRRLAADIGNHARPSNTIYDNLAIIKNTRILQQLVFLTLCSQMVAATVACNYNYMLEKAGHSQDYMTAYMGKIWMYSSVITLLCQFLLTPILLRKFSLRAVLTFVPVLNCVFMLAFAVFPSLGMSAFVYAAYKCLDYAMFKAAKEIFYIPQSFEVRYKVKQIIDSLLYRLAGGIAAL